MEEGLTTLSASMPLRMVVYLSATPVQVCPDIAFNTYLCRHQANFWIFAWCHPASGDKPNINVQTTR